MANWFVRLFLTDLDQGVSLLISTVRNWGESGSIISSRIDLRGLVSGCCRPGPLHSFSGGLCRSVKGPWAVNAFCKRIKPDCKRTISICYLPWSWEWDHLYLLSR